MTAYKIGGSEIPALLGLDRYRDPYALGVQKLYGYEQPTSEAMQLGLDSQEFHTQLLARDGFEVMPAPAEGFQHPGLDWLHVHPDGFVAIDGQRGVLELKLRGLVPSPSQRLCDYMQTFTYVHALGLEVGMVSCLHGGHGGHQFERTLVHADAELWEMTVSEAERFLDLLARGVLPAPDGSDSARDALRQRFGDVDLGGARRAPRSVWEHVLKSRELGELIDTATRQKAAHDQAVMDFMGEATELISPFDTLAATWRPSHRLDADALREEHPAVFAEFSEQRLNATALRKARPDLHARYSTPSTRKFLVKP